MRVRRGIERLQDAYRDAIARGQAAGEFAAEADAGALATFLVSNLYGLQVLARANLASDARSKTLAFILKALG
jgi:TetR/AcrR family transcriptional repressor of nem operon